MAEFRAEKAGINAEVQRKLEANYDVDLEIEARAWMEDVVSEPFPPPDPEVLEKLDELGKDFRGMELYASLRDGSYLCKVIRRLFPECNVPPRLEIPSKLPFKQRDAIESFLQACEDFGLRKIDLFVTEDLHSAAHLNQVLSTVKSLGSQAQKYGFEGPEFGPRFSDNNPREFSEEVLQEGNKVIGLQMGSNLGASQAGMTPTGLPRQILLEQERGGIGPK